MKNMLLYNGLIETMTGANTVCNSIAIHAGRIIAVGANLYHDPDFKSFPTIDLQGASVYPGFVDAHTHFYYFALSLGKAALSHCGALDSALDELERYVGTLKTGEWLLGEGLFVAEASLSDFNAAGTLDSITGSRPAVVYTRDQHTLWANSAALQIAGIDKHTPDPDGGRIERLRDGAPSGVLRENSAIKLVMDKVPPVTEKRRKQLYAQALKTAYERGVTGVHSFDTWQGFEFFCELMRKGKVGLRVSYYLQPPDIERAENVFESRPAFGVGDEWFRIAGMKIFADGALGSRTALTHQPYRSSHGATGIEVTSPRELRRLIRMAMQHKLPSAIHAIGDKAVTNCIEALSEFPPQQIAPNARHRIEHLQMIRRKDIPLLKRSGIVASMQPSHLPGDVADIQSCWGAREKNCYVFRTLLDSGIPSAFGSDVPIVELDPLGGIVDAVRRRSSDNRTILNPAERISAHEAACCFTRGAAYAAGEEDCSGMILPGYRADLTILSRNLRQTNLTNISDVSVVATILDGKVVYSVSGFHS